MTDILGCINMYESDEWYFQYDLSRKTTKPARPLTSPSQLSDTDDHWDLDSMASDNEAYEIETDASQLD
jgi:hypothetical protein